MLASKLTDQTSLVFLALTFQSKLWGLAQTKTSPSPLIHLSSHLPFFCLSFLSIGLSLIRQPWESKHNTWRGAVGLVPPAFFSMIFFSTSVTVSPIYQSCSVSLCYYKLKGRCVSSPPVLCCSVAFFSIILLLEKHIFADETLQTLWIVFLLLWMTPHAPVWPVFWNKVDVMWMGKVKQHLM